MHEAATALRFPGNRAVVLQLHFAVGLMDTSRSPAVCIESMLEYQLSVYIARFFAHTELLDFEHFKSACEQARLPIADRAPVLDLTAFL
jgi:hypothetical protein